MSVLTQSYEDLELIVVDDASPDDVEGCVRGVADGRVRYLRRSTNGGAAAARNTGIAEARGRFVAFQDSDDIWLPGKLERQVAMLSRAPDSVGVVTGAKIVYGRGRPSSAGAQTVALAPPPAGRLRLGEDQVGHLLRENRLSVQNALFRRDCHPGSDWFDQNAKANEDWEFAIRLAGLTTIREDGEPVVLGFTSPDSISSNPRRQTIGVLRILRRNRALLADRRRERSLLMLDVARTLVLVRRFRSARRFLLAGLWDHPAHVAMLVAPAVRRLLAADPRYPTPVGGVAPTGHGALAAGKR